MSLQSGRRPPFSIQRHLAPWVHRRLEAARLRLSRADDLLWPSLLGLVTGLLAGLVIIVFRLGVEGVQGAFLPEQPENYEALPWPARLLLPLGGGILIGALFLWTARGMTLLGVAQVMERMAYHQGHLPWRGFFLQFVGAALAIISGHSVGREGPHVHLGAASGSLFGQWLSLPNNSIRTLTTCGSAAGIAASFNTPLAGVIFALEVVAQDYSIASFIPVILAAVSASALSVAVFGAVPAFQIPPLAMASLADLGPLLLLGLLAGGLSALFIHMVEVIAARGSPLPLFWRLTLAGGLVGLTAQAVPAVMGIGYDTVNSLLLAEIAVGGLLLLLLAKGLATAICMGLGVPGGMIGPMLFLGAVLGSLISLLAGNLPNTASAGFYALMGMGAMMGASLQAPLAALTAIMELTHSPAVIMPGMLVIVLAGLVSSQVFGKASFFVVMLRARGMDYRVSPVAQALRRSGVAEVMDSRVSRQERQLATADAVALLAEGPSWILIEEVSGVFSLLPAVALARHLAQTTEPVIDLLAIPARRLDVALIPLQASLQEALELLDQSQAEALAVQRMTAPGILHIYGILTRERIEAAYAYR